MNIGSSRWLSLLPGALVGSLAAGMALAVLCSGPATRGLAAAPGEKQKLDPAAWGADHAGQQEIPEFMESGECLFCHRTKVGVTWAGNKHNRTIREPEAEEPSLQALRAEPTAKALADQVQLILGDTRAQRFLKRSSAYGKLEMLSAGVSFGRGKRARLEGAKDAHWDADIFARQCTGCHNTAIDPQNQAFAAVSIDCFPCHGDAPAEHANDTKLIPLSQAHKDSPAVVTSICGSCHIRSGKSKTTGLPFPTNFVAGDNLFKDFQVDFSVADDPHLNSADRHVMDNVRDVVLYGREETTCLTCHDVHVGSTKRHKELPVTQSCQLCHDPGTPIKGHKAYEVHSTRCQY